MCVHYIPLPLFKISMWKAFIPKKVYLNILFGTVKSKKLL